MSDDTSKHTSDLREQLLATVFYRYHNSTKHTAKKLMSGGSYLDWANQPDPFRHYHGAPVVELSHPTLRSPVEFFSSHSFLLAHQENPDNASAAEGQLYLPPDESFVSHLLFYSMSISAWKQIRGTNNRWALRVNPSSGNLHPTETHVLPFAINGLEAGAYHYMVDKHHLEHRATGSEYPTTLWALVNESTTPYLVLCLSSILWRECWKYRERGFRYCQHDMGHALACITISAAALGWRTEPYSLFPDGAVRELLDLDKGNEMPGLIIGLRPMHSSPYPTELSTERTVRSGASKSNHSSMSGSTAKNNFFGHPNNLSQTEKQYAIVDEVQAATELDKDSCKGASSAAKEGKRLFFERRPATLVACDLDISCQIDLRTADRSGMVESVHKTFRRRRSAVDMDYRKRMQFADLQMILSTVMPGIVADFLKAIPPVLQAAEPNLACGSYFVDLFIYAHRVDDLSAGLYFVDRVERMLVPLVYVDQRESARVGSCFQDIAADGCLAISMVADLAKAYTLFGERGYRLVHYEAGSIGQCLYLSSTALGYDSTGIGCFIDDAINEYLALPEGKEVIYNFVIGSGLADDRLTTLPSYPFPDPSLQ